ncbi:trafficking protein particle complex subunit 13-like [Watersipora subatra]|uniref:trafficking protein particle complex subunit 13-like n=1 Tax=Watersipora subatra TaxID=2589382 RepID=UPI00355B899E
MAAVEKEHLLAIKVMRLTKPSLGRSNAVHLDGRDLDSDEDPFALTNWIDVQSIQQTPYECSSPALLLPQSFGNIFLGETFSSYISIHNSSQSACRNVSLKIELQTGSGRLALPSTRTSPSEVPPGHSLSEIIQHEVKEMGTHILVCTVNYMTPASTKLELKKFFKFQVLKPLELKTKFINSESADIFLEAQIQNITPAGIYLERVSIEPDPRFIAEDVSHSDASDPFERYVNPLDMYQLLYKITPKADLLDNIKILKSITAMGKLDIHWRSSMGEKGRLQTSSLQRTVPGYGDIRLTVKSMSSRVELEQPVDVTLQLVNASERKMDLRIELQNNPSCGILWTGISGRQLGTLEPNNSITLSYVFIPIKPGLQAVSGIRVLDTFLKRTHEHDNIAHIFVNSSSKNT